MANIDPKKMKKLLVNYAHPGQHHSRINKAMAQEARSIDGLSFIDLYAWYPSLIIDIDQEQQRLLDHDIIVFQFPLFWSSAPALVKEWLDLVLEPGFAWGEGGDKLAGKKMMLAITAGRPQTAYSKTGVQGADLADFLLPLHRTFELCQMVPLPPYVLFDAQGLFEQDGTRQSAHIAGYGRLLRALQAGSYQPGEQTLILSTDLATVIESP